MNADTPSLLGFMPNATPWLQSVVTAQAAALPAGELSQMIASLRKLYGKYRAALEAAAPGIERSSVLHRMIDQAMATADGVKTSCGRGCAACCHFEVEITPDEAAALAARIRDDGIVIDRARLAIQASRPRLSPEWSRFFALENRCVFLGDDNACRVYESRPAACRRLLVTTPAESCSTTGATVAPVRVLLAEVLLSAALEVAGGRYASISRLVSEALQAREVDFQAQSSAGP